MYHYILTIHYSSSPNHSPHPHLSLSLSFFCFIFDSYIPWNYHEPEIGQYNFEGQRDFVQFIKLAQEVGLLVLVRAGPYICGEWEFVRISCWMSQI